MPEAVLETVRDLRRAQILEAARGIVATDGLQALTFGELERRLAFTRGVITYHFKNKEDIVHALLDDTLRRIRDSARAAVQGAPDSRVAIEAAVRAMVVGFLEHRDAAQVLVSFWGRLGFDERARRANAALYRQYRAEAASIVRHGQQLGVFRLDADPDAAGAAMVGAVIGIATQVMFEEGAIDVDSTVALAGRSLAGWLAA